MMTIYTSASCLGAADPHGFRRVTCNCQGCHAIVWWDEELEREARRQ